LFSSPGWKYSRCSVSISTPGVCTCVTCTYQWSCPWHCIDKVWCIPSGKRIEASWSPAPQDHTRTDPSLITLRDRRKP
jgi:hypothetical protein